MEATSHLSNGKINTTLLKELAKQELVNLFEKLKGSKTLIWDRKLVGPFGLLADYTFLKRNGITQMYMLGASASITTDHVLYFIRPEPKLIELINKTFIKEDSDKRKYHLVYMPRPSFVCQKFLEDHELLPYFEGIYSFPVYLYPFDSDLVSLEMDQVFKEIHIEEDSSILYEVAMSIITIQRLYGLIPTVYGAGKNAKTVYSLMERLRKEFKLDHQSNRPPSQIDAILLIDRSIDLISPMLTQLTYEGLLDEIFGIKNNSIKLPAIKFAQLEQKPSSDGSNRDSVSADLPTELRQFTLNSSEELYVSLRDQNFNAVPIALKNTSKQLNEQFEERHKAKSITELKAFVDKIPFLQAKRKSLANHLVIAELVTEVTSSEQFRNCLATEQEFVGGQNTDKVNPYIEEQLACSVPITKVMRLICLQSLINNGLKPKVLEFYKREVLQVYGFQQLLNLCNLEKCGLLRTYGGASGRNYSTLKRLFKLMVENVNEQNPTDIAYVHSCFAPLSARLCQMMTTSGWKATSDLLRQVNEPFFEEFQEAAQVRRRRNSVGSESSSTLNDDQKTVLVFFIGGCTYAEIASLRFLSKQEDANTDFIIGTTKVVNGSLFMESLFEDLEKMNETT